MHLYRDTGDADILSRFFVSSPKNLDNSTKLQFVCFLLREYRDLQLWMLTTYSRVCYWTAKSAQILN